MRHSLIIIWIFIFGLTACSKNKQAEVKSWRAILSTAEASVADKIWALSAAAAYAHDSITYNGKKQADSLSRQALDLAQVSGEPHAQLQAYNTALRYRNWLKEEAHLARTYIQSSIAAGQQLGKEHFVADAAQAGAVYHLGMGETEDALALIRRFSNLQKGNDAYQTEMLLLRSQVWGQENKPFEQLSDLLDAQQLALQLKNDSLLQQTNNGLFDFYFLQQNYQQALIYNQQQKGLLFEQKPFDSLAFYNNELNRVILLNKEKGYNAAEILAKEIYFFAKQHQQQMTANVSQSQLRTSYIESLRFKDLKQWYLVTNPTELQALKTNDKAMYYRVLSYSAEADGEMSKARAIMDSAQAAINPQNSYAAAHFFMRRAEQEERARNLDSAARFRERALHYTLQTNSLHDELSLAESLQQYYAEAGQQQRALEMMQLSGNVKSELIALLASDNTKDLELEKILRKKEFERLKSAEEMADRHGVQVKIALVLVILIFMTLIFMAHRRVPQWWIRGMGFFSFIMFFEFIIYLIDTKLHHLTHGEPWIVLSVKVVLISLLLPFHHWLEHKVVHYLVKHRLWDDLRSRLSSVRKAITKEIPVEEH